MADLVMVDRGDPVPAARPGIPGRVWLGIVIGLGAGVVGAILLSNADALEPPAVAGAQSEVPIVGASSPISVRSQAALADLGVGILAIVESDFQGLDIIRWPAPGDDAKPSKERLPLGDLGLRTLPTLDISGRFIAFQVPLRDQPGSVLYAGYSRSVGTVATNVTGHAWDDTVAGRLVFSSERDDQLDLAAMDQQFTIVSPLATLPGFDGFAVVAAGDWGIALENASNGLVAVVDDHGGVLRWLEGSLYESGPGGWFLLERDGGLVVVDPSGGETAVLIGRDVDEALTARETLGVITAAALTPDNETIAVLGRDGMVLIGEDRVTMYTAGPSRPQLITDGALVMYPLQAGGVEVIDIETGRASEVLTEEQVRTIAFRS